MPSCHPREPSSFCRQLPLFLSSSKLPVLNSISATTREMKMKRHAVPENTSQALV